MNHETIRKSTAFISILILLIFAACQAALAGQLRAGAAWTDISPDKVKGVNLAGYTPRKSDGLHDPITARCAVIDDGETKLAFAAADLLGLFYDDILKISNMVSRKTGIPASNILIHTIHTHSAPDTQGLWGGPPKGYKQKLAEGITECFAKASADMRPAKFIVASGDVEGFNINRRHYKEKKADETLAVMRLAGGDGGTIFTLVNFALHPVVLGADNLKMTADYVYYLRQKLEKDLGGVAIFVSRDIGDANPQPIHDDIYNRAGGTFEMAEKTGNALAESVEKLLASASPAPTVKIRITVREIRIPIENKQFLGLIKSGLIKREVKNDSAASAVAIVDLGPAQILTFPGEVVSPLRAEIEPLLPGPYKFFFGMTYDAIGYIIPEYDWNESMYEESVCPGKSLAVILKDTCAAIASEMFGK